MLVRSLGQEDPLEEGMATQYSCLENAMVRGAWWATVHGVTKSRTPLKCLSTHVCRGLCYFLFSPRNLLWSVVALTLPSV